MPTIGSRSRSRSESRPVEIPPEWMNILSIINRFFLYHILLLNGSFGELLDWLVVWQFSVGPWGFGLYRLWIIQWWIHQYINISAGWKHIVLQCHINRFSQFAGREPSLSHDLPLFCITFLGLNSIHTIVEWSLVDVFNMRWRSLILMWDFDKHWGSQSGRI
jgi:hypothetical protein